MVDLLLGLANIGDNKCNTGSPCNQALLLTSLEFDANAFSVGFAEAMALKEKPASKC